MNRRTFLALGLTAAAAAALSACGRKEQDSGTAEGGLKPVKLGTLSGPHAEVAEVAAKAAAKKGLKVQVVEFSDYAQVNEALNARDIDANAFQHIPYLNKAIQSKGYKFTALGKTVIFPIGVYSLKIHSKDEIHDGGLVTVPSDAANQGRGLQLLERNGIIRLKERTGSHATVHDIVDNPKHLKFREVESANLGRTLPDVEFAVINGSWAVKSNLTPSRDAFLLEGADSDFANVLVVQTDSKDRPEFKILLESFESPEVKEFVNNKYKGSVLAAF